MIEQNQEAQSELDGIIERLHDDVVVPARATAGSAGLDLRAYLRGRTVKCSDGLSNGEIVAAEEGGEWCVTLRPGEMALIPLGFRTRLPHGVEAQIRPRSGQAFKHALTVPNAPGTIDADYVGPVIVLLINHGDRVVRIEPGQRIAQLVIAPVVQAELVEADELPATARGAGGFGSTGQ